MKPKSEFRDIKDSGCSLERRLTFLVEALLLVEDNELAVLVGLLQDVLALLDVAVVVLQAKEGGHHGHVGLNGEEHLIKKNMKTTRFQFRSCFTQRLGRADWVLSASHGANLVQMLRHVHSLSGCPSRVIWVCRESSSHLYYTSKEKPAHSHFYL